MGPSSACVRSRPKTTLSLAREGATVVIHGRDPALASRVAAGIVAHGGCAHAVFGDLTQDDAVEWLVKAAQMRKAGWGRVINISSLAATIPPPSAPDY